MVQFYFSCEHGGNIIPPEFQKKVIIEQEVLSSHKGWDIGILPLAKRLADDFNLSFSYSEVTRLLVELNRSLHSPSLFSAYTNHFSTGEKEEVLERYYFPYRIKVEEEIAAFIENGNRVIHISFHSFTPVWDGNERDGDIGLLFDPERAFEKEVAQKWNESFKKVCKLRVRDNFPYLGIDDGFTTFLRTKFSDNQYAGIEIEINQKYLDDQDKINSMYSVVAQSFELLTSQFTNRYSS